MKLSNLCLTLTKENTIIIGDEVEIRLADKDFVFGKSQVKLFITAPREINITREDSGKRKHEKGSKEVSKTT